MKILVYTMGKVGSTTVMRALESVGFTAGRAYPGNINTINLNEYDGFITMVRDPVARNISQFFETCSDIIKLSGDPVLAFRTEFPQGHGYPLLWFDYHIRPVLGIDVMKQQFLKRWGWSAYDNLLVIKTEKLNSALAEALCEFLGERDYKVEHRARGIDKFPSIDGYTYSQFLNEAKFSMRFLDALYDTDFMRHFYTQKEIKFLIERWAK